MTATNKHTLVIASVLKPVDDTRGYEKIGCTLAGSGLYVVHVIGSEASEDLTGWSGDQPERQATNPERPAINPERPAINSERPMTNPESPMTNQNGTNVAAPDIFFHSLGKFQRLSFRRWLASFRVLAIIRRLQPDVLIFCTHELATVAVYTKVFMRTKIIYDVQENYFRNILHTDAFPFLFRWPLALYVRIKEVISAQFVDLFLLAERAYEKQLGFARGKSVVIENKAVIPPDFRRNPAPGIELLFSGTLSESTGVFEAIRIASLLHAEDNSIRLHIIGYCAKTADRVRIKGQARGKSFIQLTGIDNLQPHALILQAISRASFGVVCYPRSLHTDGAVPTKVYEYLACGLPALATADWATLFEPCTAAVVFGRDTTAKEIIHRLKNGKFYSRRPEGTLWKDEETALIRSVSQLLKQDPDNKDLVA